MVKSEHHCWTKYNYDTEYLSSLRNYTTLDNRVNYICWGYEICPTTKRKHLQGYIQFRSRVEGPTVARILGCNNRDCNGSDDDNRNYCSKEDTKDPEYTPFFEEYGERRAIKRKEKSKDSRLMLACNALKRGLDLAEVIEEFPDVYVKFHTGMEKLSKYKSFKYFEVKQGPWAWDIPWDNTKSHIIYGETNIGKTEYVKSCFPHALFVTHIDGLARFRCGKYDAIIFDDVSFLHIPDRSQLHLVDQDNDRDIHIRYGIVTIPANTPKFFMHNNKKGVVNYWEFPEIRRRVDICKMTKTSYSFIQ